MNLLCSVLILTLVTRASLDKQHNTYEKYDNVELLVNTVGPYYNKQETYTYFSLPFCVGSADSITKYHATLGEALEGVRLVNSGIGIHFNYNKSKEEYCYIHLDKELSEAFVYAVKTHYWYQMYFDDLPIWNIVGQVVDNKHYIWTHKKFEIGYNGKRIVDVNLTVERKVELTPDTQLSFTYEVIWTSSHVKFEDRFDKYLDYDFFQNKIHTYGIFSSFVVVALAVGAVSAILWRLLRKDQDTDKTQLNAYDESGWKRLHGDVFRPPSHSLYFSALIGAGHQLTLVAFIAVCYAAIGELYTQKSALLTISIYIYIATSPINGYFGGSLYARMGGMMRIRQMIVSAFILPAFACVYPLYISLLAIYYRSSRAIPFNVMIILACICSFVVLPLTVAGAIAGRWLAGKPNYPCRVNAVHRLVPEKKRILTPLVMFLLGGVLPFASIFMEIYFIFVSMWTYKIYCVYGFMLTVLINLIITTVCVTIVCTYFLLNAEDHRWQWTSFLIAASTSAYVYIYAIFYFFFKTKMYGLFQTAIYFGYTTLFCGALGVMCGTVGYVGASVFVKKIYSSIKIATVEDDDTEICKRSEDSDENTENAESTETTDVNFIFVGEKNDMLFSQETAEDIPYEELPDDFFDLTRTRATNVLRNVKKQRDLLKNAPLLTTNVQNLEVTKKQRREMKECKKSVIRVLFPDKMVLQGTFNPSDTVKDVVEFVRQYLEDKSMNFYVFTTPPKCILKENRTLLEEGFVPGAVVHFGVHDIGQESYLRRDLQSTFSDNSVKSLTEA